MLINGTSISIYGGTLLSVEWNATDITTVENWLDTAVHPNFYRQQEKYSNANITILVEGSSYDDAEQKASNIVAKMKKATLSFTQRNYEISGYLENAKVEMINPKVRIIEASYKGRKLAPQQVFTLSSSNNIYVNGNCTVPAKINIVPSQYISTLSITIGSNTYTFNNLSSGLTYVADTENSLLLENGVNYANYGSWEMPTINSGSNTVTVSPSSAALGATITLIVQGRWI